MKKEFLLSTTGMTGIEQNPLLPEPEPARETTNRSIAAGLLQELMYFILKKQYGIDEGYEINNIFHDDYHGIEDDTIEMRIVPLTEDPDEISNIQNACQSFLGNLKAVAQPHSLVDIDIENLSIQAVENLDLFTALSVYLEDKKFKLSTLDKVRISYDLPSKENHSAETRQQARDEALANYARKAREIMKDEKVQAKLFEYVEAKPYPTRQHFEAAMHLVLQVDIPVSMDHIRKTIMWEDGIILDETKDSAYEFGGYH